MRPESGVSVVKTSQLLWGKASTAIQKAVRREPKGLVPGFESLLRHRDEAHVVLGVASCF